MMSRRARIKGIANIPVRRKNDTQDNIPKNTTQESEGNLVAIIANVEQNTSNILEQTEQKDDDNQSTTTNLTIHPKETESQQSNAAALTNTQQESENQNLEKRDTENRNETEISNQVPENNKENKIATEPKLIRRWVPKPLIRVPARKLKCPELPEKDKNETVNTNDKTTTENAVIESPKENIAFPAPFTEHVDINKSNSTTDSGISLSAETESAQVRPLSPSKSLNRARIRPIPKLIRRSSVQGSASESEDDGRKSNRTRNDSICSTISQNTDLSPSKNKITFIRSKVGQVHKKFQRSEQTRKLLEAKKQFQQRFGTNIPDKKRLTMFDLIYYNPVTNPMAQREKIAIANCESKVNIINIEEVDDPDEPGKEEDNNPVPQVKVGPNGEIILDEQSLVIEQTGAKQGREQLANSQIVVDDLDRAYGIYKKAQRTKDWSARETLRFYKTLNTVGTDFSLMLSLFPGRTRRDLKSKFKREERVNRYLIDKCLMNPLQFDLSELEKQLMIDQNTHETKKKERAPKVKKIKQRRINKSALSRDIDGEHTNIVKIDKAARKRKDLYSVLENSLDSILGSDTEEEFQPSKIIKTERPITRPSRSCRSTRRISYMQSDSEECNSASEENMDDDNEFNECSTEQPVNSELENNQNEQESENNDTEVTGKELVRTGTLPDGTELNNSAEQMSSVKPGSLMILSTEGEEGQSIYRVFMVTPNNENVPMNLTPDVIQSLTSNMGESDTLTLHLPVIHDTVSDAQHV